MGIAYCLVASDGACRNGQCGSCLVVDASSATLTVFIVDNCLVTRDSTAVDGQRSPVVDAAAIDGIATGNSAATCGPEGQVTTLVYEDDLSIALVAFCSRAGQGVPVQVKGDGLLILDIQITANRDVLTKFNIRAINCDGFEQSFRCRDCCLSLSPCHLSDYEQQGKRE